ncbi:restriction endonuclease subunit S [Microcoleus sp. MOSTC5]|uniref:restriction endonuclease subunit S n=1 Tax=Microcoleus sp. MOSTC5 TaxID=3055378 RepID=UPI002FD1DF54
MNGANHHTNNTENDFANSWASAKLGDIFDLEYGKALRKSDRSGSGQYPVFGSSGMIGYHNEYLVEGAALIVGRKGSVGEIFISEQNFWAIDTTYFVRVPGEINVRFAYYLFIFLNLAKLDKSTAIPGLNRNDVYELNIQISPRNEQDRIVAKIEELFSELDKGVEYLRTAQAQLKVYRQSVMKYAFEGKLTEEWREAHADPLETANQLLERIQQERENRYQQQLNEWEEAVKAWEENGKEGKKPSKPKEPEIVPPLTERDTVNLLELPESWTWISLAHIKEFSMYGPRFSSKDYVDEGVAILRTTDVSDSGKVDWKNSPKLLISDDEYEKYKLLEGDLLITRTGSIGTISVFNDDRKAIAGAFLIHYRLVTHINSWFIFYFLKSQRAQNHFYENSTGSGRPNLNVPNIELLAIPLPSSEEQNKIVQMLEEKNSVLDSFEATIGETLKKVNVLRQSILKKAFSGHLIAQDPNDEPASILLEWIRAERLAELKPTRKISNSRKKPRKKEVVDLISVLESADSWLSAQDAFRECGVSDGAETDMIEKLFVELRDLEKEDRIEVERRGDEEWLRIRSTGRS